ncbi:hypothetical protein GCM10010294_07080 [Streptomyces griseoloalbus]|uniref:hypothetical protein n=1 Tax=Streptomyces griseoloalbus TaxID=67303 RepID=UPI00199E1B7F|nr:hypothetical protein GCM10010294_07080 [Streptomyces griseoloalbus]
MPAGLADDTADILGSSPAALRVSPDVQRVLGRAPRPFADWAARKVAAFRRDWSAPPATAFVFGDPLLTVEESDPTPTPT